jgi:hypothetical protein
MKTTPRQAESGSSWKGTRKKMSMAGGAWGGKRLSFENQIQRASERVSKEGGKEGGREEGREREAEARETNAVWGWVLEGMCGSVWCGVSMRVR